MENAMVFYLNFDKLAFTYGVCQNTEKTHPETGEYQALHNMVTELYCVIIMIRCYSKYGTPKRYQFIEHEKEREITQGKRMNIILAGSADSNQSILFIFEDQKTFITTLWQGCCFRR
ncbi:hypothetical protein PHYBLDRAFT_176293 [Phycomyces blakesleeanus NRRL 1555(-)]|uniref:Uncharacterized protein n=1 Tax=Phycomyces blakesleeanus (strain ATCC 8743b / DSM 1359 / FGSC 10004 / NBRC 33097 / NRRL 1555) TaxID=763407 RepID=A0A162T0G8_PHYB8|nr:hypothetical protein PHYBLDRAFT_176293 [Phycomyces blakesleeanus NRRL 1555(-)]OAD65242.1 hypothetical protein PHYBLDRAFT_176293 [Phycomyces blakesleeanus NRRL 1555(-)]|eukprot:XP_018283282.1 hypothetical protein PHYBLDRAFT_176293 [Phycomyces blakesleeanus NRRL 1555(-)]